MRTSLLQHLVDPIHLQPLTLHSEQVSGPEIVSGSLAASDGTRYPIVDRIPRFVLTDDPLQRQTSNAFAFKWAKRDTYDSPAALANEARWHVEKYGFDSSEDWCAYFSSRERILDAGCGSGASSSLWLASASWSGAPLWVGADISEAVDVAWQRLHHVPNTHFVQADVLQLPFPDGSFDTIFSEGVLHHTPSTRDALLAVARTLASGGEFHFYVYRRKAPVREFTDDYVREQLASLSDEEAWAALRPLTHLGRVLCELKAEIELPDDIPVLGIKAGRHDVQRLLYWHFAKLFWNEDLSFEENVHINFDWYRPRYAHRQTAQDVRDWCEEAGLAISWFHEQESGFSVRATKR